jgi:ribosomal protein S30
MDLTIEILEKGIQRAKIETKEKNSAIRRLRNLQLYEQK